MRPWNLLAAASAIVAVTLAVAVPVRAAEDTERFVVKVLPVLSITSPATQVNLNHDGKDEPQEFPTQEWLVSCNAPNGATVVFETDQAFTNDLGPGKVFKRNASLSLAIKAGTGAAWSVTGASAQTDHGNGSEVVSVTADSNNPGDAVFNLDVELLETSFADLAAGDYVMTVKGTLTAKP